MWQTGRQTDDKSIDLPPAAELAAIATRTRMAIRVILAARNLRRHQKIVFCRVFIALWRRYFCCHDFSAGTLARRHSLALCCGLWRHCAERRERVDSRRRHTAQLCVSADHWHSVGRQAKLSVIRDVQMLQFKHGHTQHGGSVAERLACWTQAQKGPGSNRSRDAVGYTVLGKLFTPIVPLFTKQQNW